MASQYRTDVKAPRRHVHIAGELVVVERQMMTKNGLISALSRKYHLPDAESRLLLAVQVTPLVSQMKDDMALFRALNKRMGQRRCMSSATGQSLRRAGLVLGCEVGVTAPSEITPQLASQANRHLEPMALNRFLKPTKIFR